jgi:hypothetical protein
MSEVIEQPERASPMTGGAERLVPLLTAYFDCEFYLNANADVREAGLDPVLHYLCHGEAEGRQPRPDFDPASVRAELGPNLPANAGNLLAHCIGIGYFEARAVERAEVAAIAPCFDRAFYLAENRDVASAQLDPALHYVRQGEAEGRCPRADFDPNAVRLDLGERLEGHDGNLFAYCIRTGYLAERARELADAAAIRPFFDRAYYCKVYPDVAQAGVDPVLHYLRDGEPEGRRPRKDFSPRAYGALLSIEEKVEITNLFVHFVTERGADFSLLQRRSSTQPLAPANITILAHHHELAKDVGPHFDTAHYLAQIPSAAASGIDPVLHYLAAGEAMGLNPRADFDVNYYLETNLDLKAAGISPFGHYVRNGRAERRSPAPYHKIPGPFSPLVSVIVPNYNHAEFLAQRFESIFAQSYRNFELIVLDDASGDNSIAVIEAARPRGGENFRTVYNAVNSGNIFAQWRKGIDLAQGELIWICESDDFCEPDFLDRMVAHFRDRAIMLAFGRIQFCDARGEMQPGLDEYRESAWPGMWAAPSSARRRPGSLNASASRTSSPMLAAVSSAGRNCPKRSGRKRKPTGSRATGFCIRSWPGAAALPMSRKRWPISASMEGTARPRIFVSRIIIGSMPRFCAIWSRCGACPPGPGSAWWRKSARNMRITACPKRRTNSRR